MENIFDLSKDVFNYIEKAIDENRLNEAKIVIEEYEQKVKKYDEDIYSYKAMIYISEDNLSAAEDVLIKGLIIYPRSFDLLYNIAYVNECKRDYKNAAYFYNYAALYCINSEIKQEIFMVIDGIHDGIDTCLEKKINYGNQEKTFFYKLIFQFFQNLNANIIEDINYSKITYKIGSNIITDKYSVSDNLENLMNIYINEKNEKKKVEFLTCILSIILYNTERYFIEENSAGEKIIKVIYRGAVNFINNKCSMAQKNNTFINEVGQIQNDETIIVFGLSLGEHISILLDKINNKGKIVVIEPKLEIYNLFKQSNNYSKVINNDKVSIFLSKDKVLADRLSKIFEDDANVKFISYSNYNKLFKEEHQEVCEKLKISFKVNYKLEPEGFSYKLQECIKKKKIEVLVTGISYAMYAFCPDFMERPTFNFALNSQDIFYDFEIAKYLMNFKNIRENLKYVILSLAYYSFDYDLSKSKNEARLLHRYIENIGTLHNYQNKKGMKILHEIHKQIYAIDDFNKIYMNNFIKMTSEGDRINQRELAVKHSSNNFPETVIENEKLLEDYLVMLYKNNVKPIVVVCPTSKVYNEYYSSDSRERFYKSIYKLKSKYHFQILDYFYSDKFSINDYFDGSHLNKNGAKKFADILLHDVIW